MLEENEEHLSEETRLERQVRIRQRNKGRNSHHSEETIQKKTLILCFNEQEVLNDQQERWGKDVFVCVHAHTCVCVCTHKHKELWV